MQAAEREAKARRVYYLSMEFLMGRSLGNALAALDLRDGAAAAVQRARAATLEDVAEQEPDAALGNGGLGRLAACFLDSMATLGLPSFGYGIRYEYGMFAQDIVARPPGRASRPLARRRHAVGISARRHQLCRCASAAGSSTTATRRVLARRPARCCAKAYDMVVPGHGTRQVSTLRLWQAAAPAHIDLHAFNSGDYARAAEVKNEFENISWVLYPNDSTPAGRELRLRQEYFFVAASMQDIVARHLDEHGSARQPGRQGRDPPERHPPGDRRGRADAPAGRRARHGLGRRLGAVHAQVFSYTNHTLMPEALETWPVALMQHVLPRHLQIILRINHDFLLEAARAPPGRRRRSCGACR